jgi:diaminohydroxyphosphoribosylaminopyrimidine deaminase/5-amino-6-(5-phosphoribosylamino)uracil reductase
MATTAELAAMRRAIALSANAVGTTNPNPSVGAVLLDAAGAIVGEGVTQPVGGDHAEVVALRSAATRTQGATIVVSLEPCAHTGRTRPCTDAIVAAGVTRVVYAMTDPHPNAGGGGERLRDQGTSVESGVLADEAAHVLGPWIAAVTRRRPHLTWKYAATLDGRTAAENGTSKWITGEAARADAHRERSRVDAVIAGIGTVLADDPQLTVRDWPATRQPLRVVVDGDARTPPDARVLDDTAQTAIAIGNDADEHRVAALEAGGAEIIRLPRPAGRVDLSALLAVLFDREVMIALVEGGAMLATSFLRDGLVDRVVGYHAPLLLGAGTPMIGDLGIATLGDAVRLDLDAVSRVGDDVRIVSNVMTGSG